MKTHLAFIVTAVALSCASSAAAQGQDPAGIWTLTPSLALRPGSVRAAISGPQTVVALNRGALDARLAQAPREDAAGLIAGGDIEFTLPMPEGGFARFRVVESPILAPELEALFPGFKTYLGRGVDDPTATARFDLTATGFHAMVLRVAGTVLIDPEAPGELTQYVSYRKADALSQNQPWICLVDGQQDRDAGQRAVNSFPITNGTQKRTYRLALAATGEYTAAAGGTKALALSRMTTTMNRVNGVYERELAVHLTMATGTGADPTALIYTDGTTDPYTNDNGPAMLTENQANLDSVVGTANYDMGHVFSTGGGGVASLQVPCVAGSKARGVTGLSDPVGDGFDIDFVAHEMGHQFGANHTFNATSGNCAGNISAHAYEVGSGVTIMAYAGICSPQDLALHSIDNFHVESLNEITAFITSGSGSTCGTVTATGNSPPAVGATANYTIPRQTPFSLAVTASPFNGANALTYNWEEYDLGSSSATVLDATTDSGNRPLLRPYSSTTTATRTLPSLTYILNNANVPPSTYACVGGGTCLTGETLPTTSRAMTFRVTVRDNNAGAGAIATAAIVVTSTTAAGPFAVTAPNTVVTWTGGSTQSVTWSVAGTDAAPINASAVQISLSTDGGTTFPTVLAASVPNNGSAAVNVPNTPTTTARIKVERVGNIFFDISNTDFTISAGPITPTITAQPSNQSIAPGLTAILTVTASGSGLSYQWYAGSSGVTVNPVGTNSSSYTTSALINNTKYWVRVSNAGGSVDSVTAQVSVTFTDPTLTATSIKAVHLTELRARINGLRARYNLAAYAFTDPTIVAGATIVKAQHIGDLRTALAQAYSAASITPPSYTDPTLTAGVTVVKASNLDELRAAIIALE